jgi:hypothetical protein
MYKLCQAFNGVEASSVMRVEDSACIPFDPANTDYQAYLKWLSEGNEPLPADEPAAEPAAEPVAEPVAEPLPPDEVPE